MSEFWSALIVLVLLCGSAAAGFYIRRFIPKAHRSAESAALLQLVVGLLVTFAAIVLGLLTTSVKTAFDSADHNGGSMPPSSSSWTDACAPTAPMPMRSVVFCRTTRKG